MWILQQDAERQTPLVILEKGAMLNNSWNSGDNVAVTKLAQGLLQETNGFVQNPFVCGEEVKCRDLCRDKGSLLQISLSGISFSQVLSSSHNPVQPIQNLLWFLLISTLFPSSTMKQWVYINYMLKPSLSPNGVDTKTILNVFAWMAGVLSLQSILLQGFNFYIFIVFCLWWASRWIFTSTITFWHQHYFPSRGYFKIYSVIRVFYCCAHRVQSWEIQFCKASQNRYSIQILL